jgi:3-phenylpropionate/cinnamic acid dioxygenase small subunit
VPIDYALYHEVQQFLFHEARLLDERRFDEWLTLFTEDCRYWMPVRQTTMRAADELRGDDELPLFDDDKQFLTARVYRLTRTPLAHAERPPSRTRHFVTNVTIEELDNSELDVSANVLVYQSRLERTESTFVGFRRDRLRRSGETWRILDRKIVLDQTLVPRTVSIFF